MGVPCPSRCMRTARRLRSISGLAAALAALALATAPASAHGLRAGRPGDAGVPGMSEHQLRDFETAALGPEHAAEHARLRTQIRRQGAAGPASSTTALRSAATAVAPSIGGRWRPPFSIPVIGINAIVL